MRSVENNTGAKRQRSPEVIQQQQKKKKKMLCVTADFCICVQGYSHVSSLFSRSASFGMDGEMVGLLSEIR